MYGSYHIISIFLFVVICDRHNTYDFNKFLITKIVGGPYQALSSESLSLSVAESRIVCNIGTKGDKLGGGIGVCGK